jgi:hypothetical protein
MDFHGYPVYAWLFLGLNRASDSTRMVGDLNALQLNGFDISGYDSHALVCPRQAGRFIGSDELTSGITFWAHRSALGVPIRTPHSLTDNPPSGPSALRIDRCANVAR